ncbi:MAG TPA: HAD family hydrolase [Candidatus Micrarchaeota archaeon]|nr:HAD family hydrolase [Candidatus Micrarchaeota archaeon]
METSAKKPSEGPKSDVSKKARLDGAGAIFIDRDGVINKTVVTYVTHPNLFEFEEKAVEGLKSLSSLGMPMIVVTNQSIIGRGLAKACTLLEIHGKMRKRLKERGIELHDVFYCPHAPNEMCGCRKPKTGMLDLAVEKYGIDLKKSYVIGDTTGDILMGNRAGCATILVQTGYAGGDKRHPEAKPDFIAKDLEDAYGIIRKIERK